MEDVEASFKFAVGQVFRVNDPKSAFINCKYEVGGTLVIKEVDTRDESATCTQGCRVVQYDVNMGHIELLGEDNEMPDEENTVEIGDDEFQYEVGQKFTIQNAREMGIYGKYSDGDTLEIVEVASGGFAQDKNQYWLTRSFVENGCLDLITEGTQEEEPEVKPIASDGGSSSYYDIQLPEWLVENICSREAGGQAYIKTEELIEAAFDNDFDFGNIFKSTVRAHGAFNGAGKAGNGVDYEANKIKYSADKVKARYGRKDSE